MGDRKLPGGITLSMHKAIYWLADHGGEGVFTKPTRRYPNQKLIAQGEVAPFEKVTWERLRDELFVAFSLTDRVTIRPKGREHVKVFPEQLTPTYAVENYHVGRVWPYPGAE